MLRFEVHHLPVNNQKECVSILNITALSWVYRKSTLCILHVFQARQELEKIRRRLEAEIGDLREQLSEKRQQVEDLQAQLAKREEEVQTAYQK